MRLRFPLFAIVAFALAGAPAWAQPAPIYAGPAGAAAAAGTGWVNVAVSGAGASDYTTTINNTIASANTAYLPNTSGIATTYNISAPLTPAAGSTIRCDPGVTVNDTAATQLLSVSASAVTIINCMFTGSGVLGIISSDHFLWDGGGSNGTGGLFISGAGAQYDTVQNTRQLNSTGTAISLQNGAFSAKILNNEFQTNAGFGVWVTGGANGNLIQGNWTDSNGIELVGITYTGFANRVIGNRATGTGDNCFSISGYNNIVADNRAYGCAFTGIYIYGNSNTVTGNTAMDNGQVHNTSFKYYNSSNSNAYAGIEINGGFGGFGASDTVVGNFADDDQTTTTQAYAGEIGPGYSNWSASTAYGANAYVTNAGNLYENLGVAATSGTTAPTCTSGTCSDGTITWTWIIAETFGTKEPTNNVFSSNRLWRFKTAVFIDSTVNHNNTITLETSFAFNGGTGNTASDSTLVTGWQISQTQWTSGVSVTYGQTYFFSTGSARYRCVSVGGTSTVVPTTLSGTQTTSDGITWLYLGSGRLQETWGNSNGFSSIEVPLYVQNLASATTGGTTMPAIMAGAGSPQSVVTAPAGSIYINISGGSVNTLWVKESGTGSTGWTAK